jgi:ABC-2 type transport system permease protein
MGELADGTRDAFVLAAREARQFFRRPLRILSTFMGPLVLLGFAIVLGTAFRYRPDGYSYAAFLIPGIVGQRMIGNAARGGLGLIRDRNGGFLREVLVAPVARPAILMGISMGHLLRSVFQCLVLLGVGFFLGIQFGGGLLAPINFIMCMLVAVTMGLAIVILSLAIAWKMDDAQNFSLISGYISLPLFIFSGSLVRLKDMPWYIELLGRLDPLTYAVDAMRYFALDPSVARYPIAFDLMAVLGIFLITLAIGLRVMRSSRG